MIAVCHRVFASLCIALWLFAAVNAGETEPQLYGIDKVMHDHSMRFYQPIDSATSSSTNPYGVFPDKNLQYFKSRDQDLAHTLHEDAVHESGVLLVGTHKSWALGRKQTYYLSMIRPGTNLGHQFGLNRADRRSPNGKAAFAFWRHKGAEIKVLDVCTISHTGAGYDTKNLGDLVPLRDVRAVV